MTRSTKKVTFWDETESYGERVPLLPAASDDAGSLADAERKQLHGTLFPYYSQGSAAAAASDAVVALEKLPALLVLTCSVFTVTGSCSVLLGAVKSGFVEDMGTMWCLLPLTLACLWFILELGRSVVLVRRAMLDEEGRRVLSVRRMRRRLRRRSARAGVQRQQQYRDIVAHAASAASAASAAAARQGQPTDTDAREFDDDDELDDDGDADVESDGGGGGGGGGGTAAEGGADRPASLPSLRQRPPLTRAPSSRLQRHLSRGRSQSVPPIAAPLSGDLAAAATAGGPPSTPSPYTVSEWKEAEKDQAEADARGWRRRRSSGGGSGSDGSGEPKSLSPQTVPTPPDAAGRSMRVSSLLQTWLRLWVAMAWFALTLFATLILGGLRLCGISGRYLPAGWIASPIMLSLVVLALQSLVILDGSGGRGGGSAMRGGGHPLVVALLGRRSFILLALCAVLLISMKIDSSANTTSASTGDSDDLASSGSGSGLWATVAGLVGKAHWVVIFLPVWAMFALLETVYLSALWENYSGKSLACALFGSVQRDLRGAGGLGYWLCCCCCRCDGGAAGGEGGCRGIFQCPPWGWGYGTSSSVYGRLGGEDEEQGVPRGATGGGEGTGVNEELPQRYPARAATAAYMSVSSPIRQRMELNPSQRTAAASIAAGVFLLTMSVVSVTVGSTKKQADWGVSMTILTAAAGLGMTGAGIRRLALAFYHEMRGPLPPVTKPLPVFYSDRDGGWTVAPPDPPVVSIFLLGDVTLRQEGFGWGVGGDIRGVGGCDGDPDRDSDESEVLWSATF